MKRILTFLKLFRYDLLVMLVALKHRDTPKKVKGLLVAAIIYLISPIDLVPDAIPLAGIIDDAVVVPTVVMGLTNILPSHVRHQAEDQAGKMLRYMPAILAAATLFVVCWLGLIIYGLYRLFS
ncbi:hypothetical protein SELR_04050 [Selenomonas ruminantium subsp. lactilytica TAM6421]|uniref:DUF1232 domain-containing protein n=1 Tax=Selenomonas ruminantium subsp. lactilytica (strain NBRC 103574 / TAM6421) TaxID=927704 RepID=I0GMX6_SELRL|nr:DUF1232 domain-containing protein [Selenomonas ruminantium]BAL82113.1 hypothetical protein SELR_04050 [Selenomonas ruminantium subsp. lactilytica TAM6421]